MESLRLQGHTLLFGPDLLLFNAEGTRELFARYGIADEAAAEAALHFSEGWAAALRLSMQRYREQGLLEPVRDMENIINELFFEAYDDRDQKLLMEFSVLNSFTSRQAALLSGDPEAGRRVWELCGNNSLLHYNETNDQCSMHGLLRGYLTRCLREKACPAADAIDECGLHRKAANCALADNNPFQAIRQFALAGADDDLLAILRLFETPDEGLLLNTNPRNFSPLSRPSRGGCASAAPSGISASSTAIWSRWTGKGVGTTVRSRGQAAGLSRADRRDTGRNRTHSCRA